MHGSFKRFYAEVREMVESGCASWRTLAAKPDGPAANVVEALIEYAKRLEDKLLDEHDPEASNVLALRIDETSRWLPCSRGYCHTPTAKLGGNPKAKLRTG